MNGHRRVARTVALGACAALLIVGWHFLAPRQLGGRTSYVTTSGSSMEPALHQGDLAIVRRSPAYGPGDVVAYRNPDIHRVVLHRIVSVDGGRFVLKGDNNGWLDAYRPTREEILGSMAFHVPGLGRPLGAVRNPWGMSAVVSVAGLAVVGGRRHVRRGRRSEASSERESAPGVRARSDRGTPHRRSARIPAALVPALAGMAALSLGLGAVAFALSPTTTIERDIAYELHGTFSYGADVPELGESVYGRDSVQTGDPVYLELTTRLDVSFESLLEAQGLLDVSGSARLVAEVSDVNGWTRTIELMPATTFTGSSTRAEGVLDLGALAAMTANLERVTGVVRDHYTVAVRPEVSIEGTLDGRPLAKDFQPELRFFLDPLQLQLEPAGGAPIGEEVVDPLAPATGGRVSVQASEPRVYSVLGRELGLDLLRAAAAGAAALSLLGLLVVWVLRLRSARRGEPAVIEARFGQWLVPVRAGETSGGRTVSVDSFDSLVRLATHYGHVVLHEEAAGFHAYSVEEDGVTYRYVVANGSRP